MIGVVGMFASELAVLFGDVPRFIAANADDLSIGAMMQQQQAMRSLSVYKAILNERGDPTTLISVNDVGHCTLAEQFARFLEKSANQILETKRTSKHIILKSCEKLNGSLLVKLVSGASGEHVDVVDVQSAEVDYSYDGDKASMVETRLYLSCAHGDAYMLICVEHANNGAGETALFEPFRGYLAQVVPNVVISYEPVLEAEVLESFNQVESVVVKKYLEPSDPSTALVREGDYIEVKLGHKRGRPFSMAILKELLSGNMRVTTLYGLQGGIIEDEGAMMTVSLKGPNSTKGKFVIGQGLRSKVHEVLNEKGNPVLSDDEFVDRCASRCQEIERRLGRKRL